MTIKERKEYEKNQKISHFINIAEEIFFEYGYLAATMDNIAKKSSYSKRTLYLYFENKEDLCFAIIFRAFSILEIEFTKIKESDISPEDKIRDTILFSINYILLNKKYYDLLKIFLDYEITKKDRNNYAKKCFEIQKKLLLIHKEIIEDGIKKNIFKNDTNLEISPLLIFSSNIGLFIFLNKGDAFLSQEFNTNKESIINNFIDYVINILKK
ncbi:MAG TPA: TetR/AcrR family transcriptional regulator [Spirochaetota bacterium]|nr:TetR/AcrR family transcriptional regulator [Spirochaetota bacterium]